MALKTYNSSLAVSALLQRCCGKHREYNYKVTCGQFSTALLFFQTSCAVCSIYYISHFLLLL